MGLLDCKGMCDWVKVEPVEDNCFKIFVLFQFNPEFINKFSETFEILFEILFCIRAFKLF
jgi:hypothetical protein